MQPCRFVVVDVETSGMDPARDRILSIAALTLSPAGGVEDMLHTLLNPGVDPGPTNIHGLTPALLAGQPRFADIAAAVAAQLNGRVLVAHNAAFDYAFLAAEFHRAGVALPVDSVLCTVELARLVDPGAQRFSLGALAQSWGVAQTQPHDALDDAVVLTGILGHAVDRAARLEISLPLRPAHTMTPPHFSHRVA